MQLIDDWRAVARKAWSIRLVLLAAALGGVELALPLFSDAMPRAVFGLASILVSIGAAVARLVAQPKMAPHADELPPPVPLPAPAPGPQQ